MVGRVVLILLYYCFTFKLVATEIFKKKKERIDSTTFKTTYNNIQVVINQWRLKEERTPLF